MKFPSPSNRHALSTLSRLGGNILLTTAIATLGMSACSPQLADYGSDSPNQLAAHETRKQALNPEFIADPFEPLNRGVWMANRGILVGLLQPTARLYRGVVPKPARQSVRNFTSNIIYPGRFLNNVLQGRWRGAGHESLRFLCNTTAGIGGLIDVASKWNIPKSEANFGQTFSRWGWQPSTYVMLPFFGPSDDTHALGTASDELANPLNYSYLHLSLTLRNNGLSEQTEDQVNFVRSEPDSYTAAKLAWTYLCKEQEPDWSVTSTRDPATQQTLGVAMIHCKDPEFAQQGREMSVTMPKTGRNMMFNVWMQPAPARLVYVSPGLGSHRLSQRTLALGELLYQNGYSVVTTTSSFHPEFMERVSTSALPGFPARDCRDVLAELTAIDRLLEKKYPGRCSERTLLGFSMGGYEALYLAATEKSAAPESVKFSRYVAIDMPVDLQHANLALDRYYNAPLSWPSAQRQARIENTLHKAAKIISLPPSRYVEPPFDGIESKFLVGLSFRMTLRDTIYSSQFRRNMGVLQTPLSKWRREACYDEIMGFTFHDYIHKFALPYYRCQGISLYDFNRALTLRTYSSQLRNRKDIHVLINRNDFLLDEEDIDWLESTISSSRLNIFSSGGHLGNLADPSVQKEIVKSLQ
jgi:hypothetical protein